MVIDIYLNVKKICTNCKQEKLLDDFYKRSMVPDGHCGECKGCSKQRNKHTHRNYYLANKEKILKRNIKYRKTFKESYNKNRNSQLKERRKTDVAFKLAHNLRKRMGNAIKRNQKMGSAVADLGCTILQFKQYIESKFQEGMSLANYGKWHLDHIRPLASFNLTNRDEFLKAAHYSNYQPLWAYDNLKKGASLIICSG